MDLTFFWWVYEKYTNRNINIEYRLTVMIRWQFDPTNLCHYDLV